MEQENKNKVINTKGANKEFPLTVLGVAEEVLLAIDKAGGKIDTRALSTALNIKGGAFARKLSSIKRWGLVSGQGMLVITDLGKGILHPISDEELAQTRKSAFLGVPLFLELYQRFKNNLPEDKTFIAILVREHDLKEVDAKTILNIYKNSIKEFLSLAGEETGGTMPQKIGDFGVKPKERQQEEPSFTGGVNIIVNSSMGKNSFNVKTKQEFKQLRKDLEKIWDAIEIFWKEENEK